MEAVSEDPRILLLEDALSPYVCRNLIAAARDHIAPAGVFNKAGQTAPDTELRRSQSCFLSPREGVTLDLVGLACRFSGLPKANAESVQIVRYLEGGFYSAHHDAFRTDGSIPFHRTGGQRVWSLVAYLQAPQAGGRTIFPRLEIGIEPVVGNVVVWNNCRPDGQVDPRLLHESEPIARGEKWAAVCWMRERAWSPAGEVSRAS